MCNRYADDEPDWETLREWYDLIDSSGPPRWNFEPNLNVSPTNRRPIIRPLERGNEMVIGRWGLIPPWIKDLKELKIITTNARAETVRTSNLYKKPFATSRCLVPFTAWYEWETQGKEKLPWAIKPRTDLPYAFAGMWSKWKAPEGDLISYTIVTTAPSTGIEHLHDRSPRVLVKPEFERWLRGSPDEAAEFLTPARLEYDYWRVSKAVNKSGFQAPDLLKPL